MKDGDTWRILYAASNFSTYGDVSRGLKVELTITQANGATHTLTIGMGAVVIEKGDASAEPGDPMAAYVVKGEDIYLKSRLIDGVQHFVKMAMEYDEDIGWGATWGGDYILEGGNYVAVED